jgi:dihydroorotase
MKLLLKKYFQVQQCCAVHCEDEATIKNNLEKYKAEFGEDIVTAHHLIRSEACYISSSRRLLLKKQVRVCMFSSVDCKEMSLFTEQDPLGETKLLLKFVFIIYGLLMMITQ